MKLSIWVLIASVAGQGDVGSALSESQDEGQDYYYYDDIAGRRKRGKKKNKNKNQYAAVTTPPPPVTTTTLPQPPVTTTILPAPVYSTSDFNPYGPSAGDGKIPQPYTGSDLKVCLIFIVRPKIVIFQRI